MATSLDFFLDLIDHLLLLMLEFLVLIEQLLSKVQQLLLALDVANALRLVPCHVIPQFLAELSFLRNLVVLVRVRVLHLKRVRGVRLVCNGCRNRIAWTGYAGVTVART